MYILLVAVQCLKSYFLLQTTDSCNRFQSEIFLSLLLDNLNADTAHNYSPMLYSKLLHSYWSERACFKLFI